MDIGYILYSFSGSP